jgi:hypothetical protein
LTIKERIEADIRAKLLSMSEAEAVKLLRVARLSLHAQIHTKLCRPGYCLRTCRELVKELESDP